ncbi:MAG: phosphoserine aminotransferase [Abditibacteriota bacterium]|nr:phosphoserine aminotransferase [Abditibacteriota bacterium]
MTRIHNFNAGPAVLPVEVLERVRDELVEFPEAGMSVMEMSHRSKTFEAILAGTVERMSELLALPDGYKVLFLQGGASLQFSMVPMNLLGEGRYADYILTGSWGEKAWKEAQKAGDVHLAACTQADNFARVPDVAELTLTPGASYVHFTTNETIGGVQWQSEPETGGVPLVADASSDILSRPIAVEKYGLIYAGAQKNLGPSGVTVVIAREDFLSDRADLPTMLNYRTHLKANSLYNTPNTFGIYMIGLVCEWMQKMGGLQGVARRNDEKAALIYAAIDETDFYRGHAELGSRSRMNVTWRLPSEELEKQFLREATQNQMTGLAGHRDVGGLRASLYNALPIESAQALAGFMRDFAQRNG